MAAEHLKHVELKDHELLIGVIATTIHGQDLWQHKGSLPSPSFGLECSGYILKMGRSVSSKWKCNEKVCALLLRGGGYAKSVIVHEGFVVHAPEHLDLAAAAALPHAVVMTLYCLCSSQEGQKILIHGAAGGVGSLVIQLAKYCELQVFVTVGTQEKRRFYEQLEPIFCIDCEQEDYFTRVNAETKGKGVDYILDFSGKKDFDKDLSCLGKHGKLMVIGDTMREDVHFHPGLNSLKTFQIIGVCLRLVPWRHIVGILKVLEEKIWPIIKSSSIRPIIYKTLTFDEAAEGDWLRGKTFLGNILLVSDRDRKKA